MAARAQKGPHMSRTPSHQSSAPKLIGAENAHAKRRVLLLCRSGRILISLAGLRPFSQHYVGRSWEWQKGCIATSCGCVSSSIKRQKDTPMHWITCLTVLVLHAAAGYLIFYRNWVLIDAWLFVGGAAMSLVITLFLQLLLYVRSEERKKLLIEMVQVARTDLHAIRKLLRFWR